MHSQLYCIGETWVSPKSKDWIWFSNLGSSWGLLTHCKGHPGQSNPFCFIFLAKAETQLRTVHSTLLLVSFGSCTAAESVPLAHAGKFAPNFEFDEQKPRSCHQNLRRNPEFNLSASIALLTHLTGWLHPRFRSNPTGILEFRTN